MSNSKSRFISRGRLRRGTRTAVVWLVLLGVGISLAACSPEERPQENDVRRRRQAAEEKRQLEKRRLQGPEFVGVRFGSTRNRRNVVREAPRYKIVKILGAPIETHVGYAYGFHPRDVIFEGPLDQGEFYNARIHPDDDQITSAPSTLRDYLQERFTFEARIEERESDVLILISRRQPSLLAPSQSNQSLYRVGRSKLHAVGSPLSMLVATLRDVTKLPIVDETGLDAEYDFLLEWNPAAGPAAIFESLDDIGLSLGKAKRTIPVLIVTPIPQEPQPATLEATASEPEQG